MAEQKIETIKRFSPLDIEDITTNHYYAGVPAHLIAEPSTVKSEGILASAKKIAVQLGRTFFEWNGSTMEEKLEVKANISKYFVLGDLRASSSSIDELRLQMMNAAESYLTFKYNLLFEVLSSKEAKGILFFDEMNLAPNLVKAQFYQIINDRRIGDIPISEGVLCMSAGNEAEHSRGVTEDPVPLTTRRGNYFLRPLSSDEYLTYAVETSHHQYIIGYLGFQPNDVHKIEYDLPDSVGQPCPRTWTKLSKIIKQNDKMTIQQIEMFATGMVGQGVARKFAAYVKSARGINLKEIIANPKLIEKYETDADLSIVYAIISGMVEEFRNDKKVLKPIFEMSLYFKKPEFGAFLLRSAKQIDQKSFLKAGTEDKIIDRALMDKVVDRYAKYLFPTN